MPFSFLIIDFCFKHIHLVLMLLLHLLQQRLSLFISLISFFLLHVFIVDNFPFFQLKDDFVYFPKVVDLFVPKFIVHRFLHVFKLQIIYFVLIIYYFYFFKKISLLNFLLRWLYGIEVVQISFQKSLVFVFLF